ncbi:peptidase domain-containing ABC transporter [Limobrevibacterium gyesilva]|uniref:Peptidase domain-containing ABC transporter n=1 Tax=Limobrevibacterium gyesilva TaxID=2991712 RepID=A0AA41YQQ2_9PROT|nr:peptidase domain-containing ABC transporter [Limobrevibacterium gyesilva]MCW3476827.1 peptidase domain-containing ABC transporter [Limobrevibacterium gyesilva]
MAAARYHGTDLDRDDLRIAPGTTPAPAALVEWVRNAGLWARGTRLSWRHLMRLQTSGTVVLLLNDGSAALMVRADAARNFVWLRNPAATTDEDGVAVDELRLSQVWSGEAILVRPERGGSMDAEPFSFGWLARMVWLEKKTLRDIGIGSFVLSILAILPPLLVMVVIDKVVTHQSLNTLLMVAMLLGAAAIYETYLGYIRRELILIVATRLDAKLNLHVFKRLLGLPIDYFERTQTGAVMYQLGQITKIRDFITGKLLSTMLDMVTLCVLLPVLFWISVPLTWMVIGCAGLIALIIAIYLRPIRRVYRHWMNAEIAKSTVLVETVHGIRTVKSLALEPQQREAWDRRTADAAAWRKALGDISNWPQTLVTPLEVFLQRGVLLVGAYMALTTEGMVGAGALIAFMMLSGRVSSPLVGIARLIEDLEEVRAAVSLAANVLNNRPETTSPGAGLRPRFEGGVSFRKVEFSYPGSRQRALDGVSFDVPPGTMLGLVGRSGSGKSTITRLLQGINREYEGQIKIDGADLREINLAHLRRSFGVVLQDNFLFRGSVRENIIAGRPGLTLTDAVRAARLAGAEEFIERMPQGYETVVEEGSPNLSGGQRQRLAIARALIHDPRILILDEATSALDPESEALVNANIARIAQGRTMVIVSHRLSSLTECDQILVLDQGKVMDIGPHLELLERCQVYRQLWLQQNRHLDTHKPAGPKPVLAQGD